MSLYARLRVISKAFSDDNRGSIPTEGVLAFTFLIWWYIASFQFFDAFRQKNVNLKAAYTVADLVSRQTQDLDPNYIDGLNTLFDYLTFSNKPTWIRVSVVEWDQPNNAYKIYWSYATGSHTIHDNNSINQRSAQIPVMPVGDSVVLVETFMAYEPIFSMGLDARWFDTFITTRPRFAAKVGFQGANQTAPTVHSDGTVDNSISG
ncbi:MAG: pilus assembly protein [Rhodobacteraceae bacterium]|nr:pilus assembly protein [Paracoccaceae bacterium]